MLQLELAIYYPVAFIQSLFHSQVKFGLDFKFFGAFQLYELKSLPAILYYSAGNFFRDNICLFVAIFGFDGFVKSTNFIFAKISRTQLAWQCLKTEEGNFLIRKLVLPTPKTFQFPKSISILSTRSGDNHSDLKCKEGVWLLKKREKAKKAEIKIVTVSRDHPLLNNEVFWKFYFRSNL